MSQSLFVCGLSWDTTSQGLMEFFETIGEMASARVITDHVTKRSKGYGFVQYVDEENNQEAIDAFNGKALDGRKIAVALAIPKDQSD